MHGGASSLWSRAAGNDGADVRAMDDHLVWN
jgi:hypothetical protein